jgi:hypothetical protein
VDSLVKYRECWMSNFELVVVEIDSIDSCACSYRTPNLVDYEEL